MSVQHVFADGRGPGCGYYADATIVDLGVCWQVCFSGIAAVDAVTHTVVGYEPHNGTFLPNALELQVADIFRQVERLLQAVSRKLGTQAAFKHITRAVVFLREDFPLAMNRFNDAYASEFASRGIGVYPVRTTVMKVTLPEPNALVEIQFDAVIHK